MTSDRLRRIEDLCIAALTCAVEERAAFLTTACAGDDELRREVESLLAQQDKAAGFLSVPASAVIVSAVLDPPKGTLAGQRFGAYAIGALIGMGGMGEVYRAHDETLGRDVAIKVLPPAFTADPERRARFEREARTLATLNHPRIGAIYGIEEVNGVRGLVLELIEGETLADRIAAIESVSSDPMRASGSNAPGLPIADVLVIARQIADALEAAHEKGIVHRDLKPANIKIAPDGAVKLLDFGLAKAPGTDGSRQDLSASIDGAIFGTAAYMSPEQARGQSVDKRGDIWAFGCVLYEMLTGRPAFAGDTISDTIVKILEREPDWSALPASTPVPIRRLLRTCLAKDPRQRLRDIGDFRIELDAIDEALPAAREGPVAPPAPAKTWLPWIALVALAASVGVWEARRPPTAPENPLADAQYTRVTDWEGIEAGAEISPDGKFVAFLADRDGQFDIWLSQLGTGNFRNLTADIPALQPIGSTFRKFGFSGDGSEIWFSPDTGPSMAQKIMPFMGGTPRNFLDKGATAPSYSPDGTRVAYFKNDEGDPFFVADRTGKDARQVLIEKGMHNHNPVWSSDGDWIYLARGSDPTDAMDVWRVRPSGTSLERLTTRATAVNFIAPLDTRRLLYVARAEDRSGPWLWALDVERKTSRRVSPALMQYTSVSASRDGRRVVATVANPTASLWRLPLLDRQAEDRDVQAYPLPTRRALAPRFAGTTLFYLSASGKGDGLWRVQDGQASEVSKREDGELFEPPAVSPDGSRVAIIVRREGKRHLVVMSADGRSSRTLAPSLDILGAAGQGTADWSPDGAWIVTGGGDADGPGLFKVPVDDGAPVRLVSGQAANPIWSPDGNLIVYAGRFFTGQVELLGVRPDGTHAALPAMRARPGGYRFLPNGTGLVILPFIPSLDFSLIDFAGKSSRQLTRLSNQGTIGTFDITSDGKTIVFDRSRENSDIVLIERPK